MRYFLFFGLIDFAATFGLGLFAAASNDLHASFGPNHAATLYLNNECSLRASDPLRAKCKGASSEVHHPALRATPTRGFAQSEWR